MMLRVNSALRAVRAVLVAALSALWAGLVLLAALGCLTLAGIGMAGFVSPRADAVNHLAPLTLAGSLTVVLAAALGRRLLAGGPQTAWTRRMLGMALAASLAASLWQAYRVVPELAGAAFAAPQIKAAQASLQASPQASLRIITFNIQGWEPWDPLPLAGWITGERPDLIALQEAQGNGEELRRILRAAGWRHEAHCPWRPGCNTVLLSRRPFVATSNFGQRIGAPAAWGSVRLGSGAVVPVVSAHLFWPLNRPLRRWPPPPPAQVRQMEGLAQLARRLGPDDMILVGDFNSTPWAFALSRLEARSGLTRSSRALWSWPAGPSSGLNLPAPVLPIDHVLAGTHWQVARLERGPALGPDHYPLSMTLVHVPPAVGSITETRAQARDTSDAAKDAR
jgi:endonuclease/exonuclease/phosphatase (EEP) superfamily protein YafD